MAFAVKNPTITCKLSIDFSTRKKSILGWDAILSKLATTQEQNSFFCVDVLYPSNANPVTIGIIFQTYNLYIMGLSYNNTTILTDKVEDVAYGALPQNSLLRPANFLTAFQKAVQCFSAPDDKGKITKVAEYCKTMDSRYFVFALSECARNDILRYAFFYNYNWISSSNLIGDLNLSRSFLTNTYKAYNPFTILINNWRNIARDAYQRASRTTANDIINGLLTINMVRDYFNGILPTLQQKDIDNLKNLGILF